MPRVALFLSACKTAFSLWLDRDASHHAAAVSYYALFAVTPLLLITITTSSLVYGKEYVTDIFRSWGNILGPELITLLTSAVANLESIGQSFTIPLFGSLLFAGMAVMMFNAFTIGLEGLCCADNHSKLSGLRRSAHSAEFILIISIYLIMVLGLYRIVDVLTLHVNSPLLGLFSTLINIFLTAVLFALMYRLLPQDRPNFKNRLQGALVASILFTLGRSLVGLYLALHPVADLFGAAGLLVVLLVWIYVSIAIVYYGAALSLVFSNKESG